MAKYICIRNYVSVRGTVSFKKDDVYEINPDGDRYLLNMTERTYCLISNNTFRSYFKAQFKFGR